MTPEQHQRMRELFDAALERPEADRIAFLESVCTGEPEMLQAATRLLESQRAAQSFLEKPASGVQRMGRYRITTELGRGAMGIVYEAVDPLIGRSVAVKVIHLHLLADPGEAEFMRERLFREARSAGTLSHPGIVMIFDVGGEGDTPFIAMERVDGSSLQELLKSGGTLGPGETLDILRQTASALDYAHQNGVVHRDIKPANIMLHKGTNVKITDFGIAKIASAYRDTVTGLLMGTPSYMSPEQIESRAVDGKSDQFSLAVVAFQMLTLSRPFQGVALGALAHAIAYGPRPSARAANPLLPTAVDEVLARGLATNPDERYATCTEFVGALALALRGTPPEAFTRPASLDSTNPVQNFATSDSPRRRSGWTMSVGRIKLIVGASALLVIAVSLGFLFTYWPPVSAPRVQVANPANHFYEEAQAELQAGRDSEAVKWFLRAAELGERRSMQQLGEFSLDGRGLAKNEIEAVRWFRKAADAGEPIGMLYLGAMYHLGIGITRDYATAATWYGKAANQGNSNAMFNLGTLYESGEGVIKDLKQATQLYRRAAALGNEDARKRLDQLAVP